ncbi:MAG: CDP-alcohol phosphatidyltransferase family protein [Oscillospiraceae bacterium]|nr:CDP-alcohol phosphatidyltransferase family protein [Oscillospiraceae bacterium]
MKHIPNVLTITNMMLGLASVLFLLQVNHPHKPLIVTSFILLGGVVDFFDGFLARKLNAVTEIGKQLDSFADLITFGIAPVALVNYLGNWGHSVLIITSSLLFVAAGAYRLARYNLGDFSDYFMGLPITIAGMILAVYGGAVLSRGSAMYLHAGGVATAVLLLVLSLMMVSRVKMKRIG